MIKKLKKTRKPGKNKGGRPLFDGKDEGVVTSKLLQAAEWDCNIREMCIHAGISMPAFDRYCKKYPKFRKHLEALRERPVITAKQTVAKKINSNYYTAMDFLSRKRKDDYSQRNENLGGDLKDFVPPTMSPEDQELLRKFRNGEKP